MKVFVGRAVDWLPSSAEVAKLALYADTVILRDTALAQQSRIISSSGGGPTAHAAGWTLIWLLNLLRLRPLFTADVQPPIGVLLPPVGTYAEAFDRVAPLIQSDMASYLCDLFGEEFSEEESRGILARFDTVQDLLSAVANPSLLPAEVHPPPEEPLDRLLGLVAKARGGVPVQPEADFLTKPPWGTIAKSGLGIGLLMSVRDIYFSLACSCTIDATPVIPERCWIPFEWKLAKDAAAFSELYESSDEIPSALTSTYLREDVAWLGDVPLGAVVELRQRGELEDMRQIFRGAEETLKRAPAGQFPKVAKDVWHRLDTALRRHQAQLSDIESRWKSTLKFQLGGLTVTGVLAWATTVVPLLAVPAAMVGSPTLFSIIGAYREKRQRAGELGQRPIGILWETRKRWARR